MCIRGGPDVNLVAPPAVFLSVITGSPARWTGPIDQGLGVAVDALTGYAAPVLVGDLHLDRPLPELNSDCRAREARLLARLHGRPLAEVRLPLGPRPLPATQLAGQVWSQLAGHIAAHCAGDGIAAPDRLPPAGLTRPGQPPCTPAPAAGWPAATVVIATRDRTSSLLRCLASVARLDYPAFDVVVADSAPATSETEQALARDWPFPVHYRRVDRPGLALAHNEALRAVTGEIVAITDDDVEVDPGWLTALADAFRQAGADCVTGLILPAELQTRAQVLVEAGGGFGRGFTRQAFRLGMPDRGPLFPFTAGRFGSGANMAFRTGWLRAHGGFDPAAGAGTPARGGDDLIAFLQVIVSGGTLVYEPAAVVRHWHRREYAGLRRQAFGYGVGLGAYLTATVCWQPGLAWQMLRRAIPAARHLLDPGSAKNAGQGPSFPRELVWRERAGVLAGPTAYAVSRWRYRGAAPRPGAAR
jgi:Glycosyl transferase family 2